MASFIKSYAQVWDAFKKLMPEEATRVVKYKNGFPNTIILFMKDGNTGEFTLDANGFIFKKRFK
jgi:hypothetical protein